MWAQTPRAVSSIVDDERATLAKLEADVERAIHDLPTGDLQVIRLRFGIGARRHSRGAVARQLQVRLSHVLKLERHALRDLRALALPRDLPRRRTAAHSVMESGADTTSQRRPRSRRDPRTASSPPAESAPAHNEAAPATSYIDATT